MPYHVLFNINSNYHIWPNEDSSTKPRIPRWPNEDSSTKPRIPRVTIKVKGISELGLIVATDRGNSWYYRYVPTTRFVRSGGEKASEPPWPIPCRLRGPCQAVITASIYCFISSIADGHIEFYPILRKTETEKTVHLDGRENSLHFEYYDSMMSVVQILA
jgi:hypothetical protein